MMQKLKHTVVAVAVMAFGAVGAAAVPAQPVAAAGCTSTFLTFPAWYDGLLDGSCRIKKPRGSNGLSQFIWRIVLNIISIVLQLVAYASAGYIIYGGFKYLTSSGSADRTAAAKKTIQHAVIGLIISFFSVAIVTLIASRIG